MTAAFSDRFIRHGDMNPIERKNIENNTLSFEHTLLIYKCKTWMLLQIIQAMASVTVRNICNLHLFLLCRGDDSSLFFIYCYISCDSLIHIGLSPAINNSPREKRM
jgi:hypothetical protein